MKYQNKELSENISKLLKHIKSISNLESNNKRNWIESIPLSFTDIKNIVFSSQISDGKIRYILKLLKKNQKIKCVRFFRDNESNLTTAMWVITKWGYQSY